MYIRELALKCKNGAKNVSVHCKSFDDYKNIIRKSDKEINDIMLTRLGLARVWLEYKDYHSGIPKALKYDFFA